MWKVKKFTVATVFFSNPIVLPWHLSSPELFETQLPDMKCILFINGKTICWRCIAIGIFRFSSKFMLVFKVWTHFLITSIWWDTYYVYDKLPILCRMYQEVHSFSWNLKYLVGWNVHLILFICFVVSSAEHELRKR